MFSCLLVSQHTALHPLFLEEWLVPTWFMVDSLSRLLFLIYCYTGSTVSLWFSVIARQSSSGLQNSVRRDRNGPLSHRGGSLKNFAVFVSTVDSITFYQQNLAAHTAVASTTTVEKTTTRNDRTTTLLRTVQAHDNTLPVVSTTIIIVVVLCGERLIINRFS